jgi:ribonuclease HI
MLFSQVENKSIIVYTDGSCNPAYRVGAWASIIFIDNEKIIRKGIVENTTHQRMELQPVIDTLEFLSHQKRSGSSIIFYTDSQYAVQLQHRKEKIQERNYLTKSNNIIRNDDLLRKLMQLLNSVDAVFVKVTAHRKKSFEENYNREVDKLVRAMVRQRVLELASV